MLPVKKNSLLFLRLIGSLNRFFLIEDGRSNGMLIDETFQWGDVFEIDHDFVCAVIKHCSLLNQSFPMSR